MFSFLFLLHLRMNFNVINAVKETVVLLSGETWNFQEFIWKICENLYWKFIHANSRSSMLQLAGYKQWKKRIKFLFAFSNFLRFRFTAEFLFRTQFWHRMELHSMLLGSELCQLRESASSGEFVRGQVESAHFLLLVSSLDVQNLAKIDKFLVWHQFNDSNIIIKIVQLKFLTRLLLK